MSRVAPLSDVMVVDFSQGIAGPSCGGLFAEYGARVVKVEPPGGDWMRHLGPGAPDMSAGAFAYNRGKESLAMDLKAADGRAAVLRLAEKADVVIESGRPGAAERLGLGFDAVQALNPRLVYVSISGFGQTGPKRGEPLTDTVAQALSGLMSINRGPDGVPHRIGTTIIDALTGLYTFQAASMALLQARQDGRGTHVDVSLMQCAAAIQGPKIVEYGLRGGAVQELNPPTGTYETQDGWIAIAAIKEENFPAICRALEIEFLADDPLFRTFADRIAHLAELRAILTQQCRTRPAADWLERLAREGALAAPINDYGAWLDDAQTEAVAAAPRSHLSAEHVVPLPRTPGQPAFAAPAPGIGAHSRAVLAEIGMDAAAVDRLVENGVVREAGPDGGRS